MRIIIKKVRMEEKRKCSKCKTMLSEEYFGYEQKRTGLYKTCIKCRQIAKNSRQNLKCIHGFQKCMCEICKLLPCPHSCCRNDCETCNIHVFILTILKRRMRQILGTIPNNPVEILGCSIEEYKRYIETNWEMTMTWQNYGCKKGHWSIDHSIPFFYPDESGNNPSDDLVLKRFNYKNTKPMWHVLNSKKGNKYIG